MHFVYILKTFEKHGNRKVEEKQFHSLSYIRYRINRLYGKDIAPVLYWSTKTKRKMWYFSHPDLAHDFYVYREPMW